MPKKNVKLVENNTTTTEDVTTTTTPTTEDMTTKLTDEIIEIEWTRVENIFTFKEKLENLERYFGDMCLQFEKNKTQILTQIMYGQHDMVEMAKELQTELNVDENLTYELKLPNSAGEKAFFVRKGNNS